ncbi:MAG: AraC family transcriptional regulator ligand-binding domain-containing protein [Deltaproteobacteria bacterium]
MYELPGAYVRDLVDLVASRKVAPEALVAGLPITLAQLTDPTTRIPLRVCDAIVQRAIVLTREPALAVHLGMRMRVSSHGFLGFAAMTASTVREALELAVRFSAIRTSAIALALVVEGDTASLVISERVDFGKEGLAGLREFVMLALLVGIRQLGTELTGKVPQGFAECAFATPSFVTGPIDQITFDRPAHRLVFAASLLDQKLVSADTVATRLAIEQCERELASTSDGELAARIRTALEADPATTLPAVARTLRLSSRTLKRRLAEQGTTFTDIRDELRQQRAMLLVDNRSLSIGEIAVKLGYTELPNFTRAFRKWTGMTPIAYRERRASDDPLAARRTAAKPARRTSAHRHRRAASPRRTRSCTTPRRFARSAGRGT